MGKALSGELSCPYDRSCYAIKCTYLFIIPGIHSFKYFSTMNSNFPPKSEQSRNTENNICSDLCGKQLHIEG